MSPLEAVQTFLDRISLGYWLLTGLALFLVFKFAKTRRNRRNALLVVLVLFIALPGRQGWNGYQATARYKQIEALFEEKCRTVAGEKIYRKVEGVEGILLMKVRPARTPRDEADPMWPGAAFGREFSGDSYIRSFLGYEHSSSAKAEPVKPWYRGYITPDYQPDNPSNLPGYRWVDVIDEKDGKRYRYTGSHKVVGRKDTSAPNVKLALSKDPDYDLNVYRYTLDRALVPDSVPRYGVTFEDHVIPEERALGLASSTVKVLDLETGEVLAEMTRYAWGATKATPANPSPWLTARKCPATTADLATMTRQFVDQVLVPKKEH